ncbi:MAG: sensor histidine kinase, partial [Bacteroidia bacterium]
RLEARVNIAAEIKLSADKNNNAYARVRNQYLERLPDEREFLIENGSQLNLNLPTTFYEQIDSKKLARYRKENQFFVGKKITINKKNYIIIVTANDPIGLRELRDLQKTLFAGFFLSVIFSFIVGWKFSNYMLDPLRNIIKSVKKIKAENLHLRLEVKSNDEMSQLAQTFNNMLNRLETAFETQNNFISNASHELRTPLTIISGEVELAMHNQGAGPQSRALLKIKNEAERLEHILTSLLGLAQSGFNGKNQPWEDVRIDELIWDIKETVNEVHPECKIEIDFNYLPDDDQQITLKANKNLLKLAITNIVSNGCKYSENKPVLITLETKPNLVSISVKDQGIGIPEGDVQHIFEPFYRASNTSKFNGYGVGLPLSLNIIRLHRGSIGITSLEKVGTEIKIILPIK